MQRIVVKIGTNVITRDNGLLNQSVMQSIVDQIATLKQRKMEVILVSSGAVAAGRSRLGGHKGRGGPIEERQLLAAVGQIKLMETYGKLFRKAGYQCAQVLATKEDFRDRRHYLCMRDCFSTLLHDDIIPISNENDVVAVSELMFTDNDELAGLIAAMLDADALLVLTSVDGLYNRPPGTEGAKVIETIDSSKVDGSWYASKTELSGFGRGGMHTKCRVARKLAHLGVTTYIANGQHSDVLLDIVAGKKNLGTKFLPIKNQSTIKKWIAHSEGQEKGIVFVNECVEKILKVSDRVCSLLPVGITKVAGKFSKGDVIQIQSSAGQVLGYGVAQYGSEVAVENIGQKNKRALIHYDYLYMNP